MAVATLSSPFPSQFLHILLIPFVLVVLAFCLYKFATDRPGPAMDIPCPFLPDCIVRRASLSALSWHLASN